MVSVVDVCNLALAEIGNRTQIASLSDGTAASNAAALFYTPKLQMLLRAANWDSARRQAALTVLRAKIVNGLTSTDPPPQPFAYEYSWPTDCLKARFLTYTRPPVPGGIPMMTGQDAVLCNYTPNPRAPFVVGNDLDHTTPTPVQVKVILTNLPQAQMVYTSDISQKPDLWDSLFYGAATATLACYFIQALARSGEQLKEQASLAKSAIEQARAASANEGMPTSELVPSWIAARSVSVGIGSYGTPIGFPDWDQMDLPGGLRF